MVQDKVRSFQILKLEKIFLLLGVSYFLIGFHAYAQNPCSGCYSIKRPTCEKRCQGSATRVAFSSCTDNCVATACSKFCNIRTTETKSSSSSTSTNQDPYFDPTLSVENVFHGVGGDCGKCLRREASRTCATRCSPDEVEDIVSCRRTCAKLECNSACQLPNEEAVENERRPTARDCGECKRVGEGGCKVSCEKLKDQPGYTACVVSCVEDRCNPQCNPE